MLMDRYILYGMFHKNVAKGSIVFRADLHKSEDNSASYFI